MCEGTAEAAAADAPWSVIAAGLGRCLEVGCTAPAEEAQAAIEVEIDREQAVLDTVCDAPDAELDLLRLSMTLAHNRGGRTQGMGFWRRTALTAPIMEHLSERGRFALAVRIYQHTGLAAEGHRHYPLRPVKILRRSADLLMPLCPFLDEWGRRLVAAAAAFAAGYGGIAAVAMATGMAASTIGRG